jgi:hypothetical protein
MEIVGSLQHTIPPHNDLTLTGTEESKMMVQLQYTIVTAATTRMVVGKTWDQLCGFVSLRLWLGRAFELTN